MWTGAQYWILLVKLGLVYGALILLVTGLELVGQTGLRDWKRRKQSFPFQKPPTCHPLSLRYMETRMVMVTMADYLSFFEDDGNSGHLCDQLMTQMQCS